MAAWWSPEFRAFAPTHQSLVYLDAFLPDDGDGLFDLQPKEGRENFIKMQRDTPGLVPPTFAQRHNPAMLRVLGSHPLLTLIEPVKLTERRRRSRTALMCSPGGPGPAGFQRFYDKVKALNDPSWKLVTMPTGHGIQTENPKGTAKLLLEELDR